MEFNFSHGVVYKIQNDASVADVASSLLANESLVRCTASILEGCFDGLKADVSKIKVKEISNASPLTEVLAGVIFITYQKELEKEIPKLIENISGVHMPDQYNTLITVLVMIAAVAVIESVCKKLFPEKSIKALIEDNEKNLLAASEIIGVPVDRIKTAVQERVGSKGFSALTKAALNFIRPSKRENVAIEGIGGHTISEEAIREVPRDVDFLGDDETSYPLENVEVEIHSKDVDYQKKGWSAVVKGVSDKRLRMYLIHSIEPQELWATTRVIGDIVVVQDKNDDGEYVAKSFYLTSIHKKFED